MSDEYAILGITQAQATPFVLEHMLAIGTIYDEEWSKEYSGYVTWYGAFHENTIKGVLGYMTCNTMPDDLIIVGLYGNPKSIKILGEFIMKYPHKNKFGYIDIKNESWMLALMKRGFEVSPLTERDRMGNVIHFIQLTGNS